jgi:folate-binding protein YgfZ
VRGTDALPWLDALVTADLQGLGPERSVRALLLSPTGRVRAEFTVSTPGGTLVLIQDPVQRSVLELLSRYVLSSDVELEDWTDTFGLFAFPARSAPPDLPGAAYSIPSCLGPGVDAIAPSEEHDDQLRLLSRVLPLAGPEDLEAWRVETGITRVGIDVLDEDLPQEAGLTGAVSFGKGCFLGQEAVARVRNLGHPRRVLLQVRAAEPVAPGDALVTDGQVVGEITSATRQRNRSVGLARVGWAWREGPLRTQAGTELTILRAL